jgi:hypothetical protein
MKQSGFEEMQAQAKSLVQKCYLGPVFRTHIGMLLGVHPSSVGNAINGRGPGLGKLSDLEAEILFKSIQYLSKLEALRVNFK